MAGLRLQAGAEDAVGLLGLGDRLHRRGELVVGRRHLDAVLLQQVLAVHQDEDRDVEGDADPLAVDQRQALDQRLGEVVPVEVRHRELGLVLGEFDRIDAIGREGRDPGLVEIVEVIGAELALTSCVALASTCSSGTISISTSMPVGSVNSFLIWLSTTVGGVASEV